MVWDPLSKGLHSHMSGLCAYFIPSIQSPQFNLIVEKLSGCSLATLWYCEVLQRQLHGGAVVIAVTSQLKGTRFNSLIGSGIFLYVSVYALPMLA